MTSKDSHPSIPSTLTSLTQDELSNPFTPPSPPAPAPKVEIPPVGAPLPGGHNPAVYEQMKELAEKGGTPTPGNLNDLFRMMAHDSPLGEMKAEALVIWREMRSKGIVPTKEGIIALLKVPHSWLRGINR